MYKPRAKSKKPGNKKVRNATPMEANGIKYRSKLELYMSNRLTEANIDFEYETTKFILQDKFEFPNDSYESYKSKGVKYYGLVTPKIRPITYLPDFINHKERWIIEVKGFANDAFPLKWKMFKDLLKNDNYTLFKPSTQKQVKETIEILNRVYYEKENTNTNRDISTN